MRYDINIVSPITLLFHLTDNSILLQSAPERKDASKSTVPSQKVQTAASNGIDHSNTENVIKENTELINGYSSVNGHVETIQENQRERGRQRTKKDDNKVNVEFLNQIATTMQHLQRDLDRITARVRSLEGQALQAMAPQTVCNVISSETIFTSVIKNQIISYYLNEIIE